MSFPAYPEYKDSGVVWLGGIPAHWNIKKFRYVFEESPEKITDEVVGDMLSVSGYRGIEVKQYDDEGRRRTDEELFGYRVVRPGQLVVNTMWLNYAGLGVSEHEGHVSPAYRSYWIDPAMDKRFIHHLMRSGTYVQGYTRLLTGIRPNSLQMGRDDLMVFPVLLPTKSEQTQIARFLDHETARIDALIEEQQRLIELLKEKRQAVISHAVTKGLDPTVPMKDSGVEWLGEVPAHWEVGSLRRLIKSVGNGTTADQVDEAEDTVAVSRIETISAGLINFEKVGHVGPQDVAKRFLLNVGDILFSHINSLSMIGNVAIYSGGRPLLHGMNLLRIQPLPSISSEWLLYWLKSKNVRQEVESRAKPAINQASISTDSVRALPALIPPSFEQTQIARFLDYETARIDALIEEANSGVGLLQERRSALISAAVTGKIDVRGWQPPVSTQAPESAVAEAH